MTAANHLFNTENLIFLHANNKDADRIVSHHDGYTVIQKMKERNTAMYTVTAESTLLAVDPDGVGWGQMSGSPPGKSLVTKSFHGILVRIPSISNWTQGRPALCEYKIHCQDQDLDPTPT